MKRYLLGLCFLFALHAHAQAIPWNTDIVSWMPPAQCSDGSPVAGNCDITAYKVETSSAAGNNVWTLLTQTDANGRSYSATNLTVGQHCYRVTASSASGWGTPSDPNCVNTVQPTPGPPSLKAIDTIAFAIDKTHADALALNAVGSVPLGTDCLLDDANGFHVVPRAKVTVPKGTSKPMVVVAKCE